MSNIIFGIIGLLAGTIASVIYFDNKNRNTKELQKLNKLESEKLVRANKQLDKKKDQIYSKIEDLKKYKTSLENKYKKDKIKLDEEIRTEKEINEKKHFELEENYNTSKKALEEEYETKKHEYENKLIKYNDLKKENDGLKIDLSNLHTEMKKVKVDFLAQETEKDEINKLVQETGHLYLKDNIKWISRSLNQNNFIKSKDKLNSTIERCRNMGFDVSDDYELELQNSLKDEFKEKVRVALHREEQARIKAQIREEKKREKEIKKELDRLEHEREAIKVALEKALAEAKDQHSEEVENLKMRLAEAEERSQRAVSQAQLTKSGHVYIISNIGSFGEDIYKIGMTRRLEPDLRIKELSGASVPFPFDVHMMISSDDAPTLENSLHRKFHQNRLNKINPRKEFFRVNLEEIVEHVKQNNGDIEYLIDPEALQYRQSLEIQDEDAEFIENVYEELYDDSEFEDD